MSLISALIRSTLSRVLQDINKLAAVTLFAGAVISPAWHAPSSVLPAAISRKYDRLHNNLI